MTIAYFAYFAYFYGSVLRQPFNLVREKRPGDEVDNLWAAQGPYR